MYREQFEHGEKVILDKEYRNTSIVTVVGQSSGRLFTTVEADDVRWDVMTGRLTKITDKDGKNN